MKKVLALTVLLLVLSSPANADQITLKNGDQLLLCTDGLTDMVPEEEIEIVLRTAESAQSACRSLVSLALSNGGRDNITAIVARYSIP